MKLVHFSQEGRPGQGVVQGDAVRVLPAMDGSDAFDLPARDTGEIEQLLARSGRAIPLEGLALLPPLAAQSQLICVGINYGDHAAEAGQVAQAAPTVFLRHLRGVVGHGQPLWAPRASAQFDYEGELAVVIGRRGRHIAAGEAMAHVAGYSCFMDGSVRDVQRASVTAGKNFPRSAALGPWITTRDEVPDPAVLQLRTRLNGRTVQSAPTAAMLHGVAQLVAYCSSWTELRPGDVIATGTPAGVGARRTPPLWLRAGDSVEVIIEGVGMLANPVRAEPEAT